MPPKPSDDYGHGQMMGMLVMIIMMENGLTVSNEAVLEKIKRIAVSDLATFLDKPEEDVYLMVDKEIKDIV